MRKKIIWILSLLVILPLLLIIIANVLITQNAKGKVFSDVASVEKRRVGLVLGTTKILADGRLNLYFRYRVEAAVVLYKAGKVEFLLVSGDNNRDGYDEPTDLMEELVKQGVPQDKIVLDYAGFRTHDSMIRAHKVFGLDSVIVISQQFHNERAIYIAENNGLDAIGFNARSVSGGVALKVQFLSLIHI